MQNQEQPKTVKLWSRCEAAWLDTNTGEVTLTSGVDPKFLVQDLVRELQANQQKVQELTKQLDALKAQSENVKDI